MDISGSLIIIIKGKVYRVTESVSYQWNVPLRIKKNFYICLLCVLLLISYMQLFA